MCMELTKRKEKREQERKTKYNHIFKCQTACLQVQSEQKRVVRVCEKRKGRVVKLYLYSVVMYSICGQRLYNAHITEEQKDRHARLQRTQPSI